MGRAVVVLLVGLGCGRLGYQELATGGPDAGGAADAALADAAPLGPFAEAALIDVLSDPAADDDPSLTGDLRELYFKSDRGGMNDHDIWLARRDSADAPWDPPVEVVELSTDSFEATPEVSLDGMTITFASDRPGGGGGAVDLWIATRTSRDDPWDPPVPLAALNTAAEEFAAVTDDSGELVVFNRGVPDHSYDLFQATSDGGIWSQPAALVNLSSTAYEADSHLDPGGVELYFAGELPDAEGRDMYVARRTAAGDDFAAPERVAELATPSADEDPWVSPDRRLIVFSSDRSGDQELYWATR